MGGADRALIALGGLAGALGIVLAAVAAHVTGGGNLDTASRFLLLHAPALLALAALSGTGLVRRAGARASGFLMVLGLILFCGDLSVRALWSIAPFRMAAPIGGTVLILAWLAAALAAFWPGRAGDR